MVRVCFVCLGNICRSPTAEGVMRHLVEAAGLSASVGIESAGTGAYHQGEPPDARSRRAAAARGIVVAGRARRFLASDFSRLDYVVAMDADNRRDLLELAPDAAAARKVSLLRDHDSDSPPDASVPDPYYGDGDGFEEVLDLCLAGCQGLLLQLRREHRL